jgi:hypothetical protein
MPSLEGVSVTCRCKPNNKQSTLLTLLPYVCKTRLKISKSFDTGYNKNSFRPTAGKKLTTCCQPTLRPVKGLNLLPAYGR